jgi:hypothetical protein
MTEPPPHRDVGDEEMDAFLQRQDLVHLVGLLRRPGVRSLSACIEYHWYPPGTARNDRFKVHLMRWSGLDWLVASFPAARRKPTEQLARRLGMRLVDGVPSLIADGRVTMFPGARHQDRDNQAMRTIENDPRSPLYSMRRRDDAGLLAAEEEIIELFERGQRPTARQVADYLWGTAADRFTPEAS